MSEPVRRRSLSAEMIAAISAVVIGVCAIAVSLYETTLIRQQLKGSAWPNIEVGFSYNEAGFRYFMSNSGVGPARIRHAEVTVDGTPVADWREFFERLELEVGRYLTSYVARGVLAPGVAHDILVLDPEQPADVLYGSQHRIVIELCYCSVYDDCWVKAAGSDAVPVRGCQADEDRLFRN